MIKVIDNHCRLEGVGGVVVFETIVLMKALTNVMKEQPQFAQLLTEYGAEVELEFIKELEKGTDYDF